MADIKNMAVKIRHQLVDMKGKNMKELICRVP